MKGKKYKEEVINTEEDLVRIFYKTIHLRFIIGKSMAWSNSNQLIGRFTFAKDEAEIINAFLLMNDIIEKLN